MKIIDYLCNDLIIVSPNNIKDEIVKEISLVDKMYSYKIITENELKVSLLFDYDYKAIVYLKNKLNISVANAIEYINAMYYVDDKAYKRDKLNELVCLKKELLENDLLIIDNHFKNILRNKKIIVYGFDVINKELKRLLSLLNNDYQIIKEDYNASNNVCIYKYETLEDEVDNTCYKISSMLNNIDINKIKITNVDNDYLFTFKRFAKMYNLAIDFKEKTALYSLKCIKDFINNLAINKNIEESLKSLSNEKDIYKALIGALNSLVDVDIINNIDLLIYVLKNTYLANKKYENVIEIVNLDNIHLNADEYLFVLSINQGVYPKTFKNEDFLTDNEKEELNISTSDDKNILSKKKFEILLKKSSNIILSYKIKSPFKEYVKSFVIDELNIKDNIYNKDYHITYSSLVDKLFLADVYDKTYKEENEENILALYSNYQIDYKSYSNKFKPFSSSKIKDFIIKNQIKLSYSSISNYFLCNFKYYLENLLKIKVNDKTIATDIGSIYHSLLEKSYKNDFNYENEFNNQIKDISDNKTLFYLNKYKDLMSDVVDLIHKNGENSELKKALTEKEIIVKYEEPIPIIFKGYLDKILYEIKDDKTYVAIIDYKTGDVEVDVNKIKFGLSMQLPIYLYLLKHAASFKNVVVCGFYIQKIMPKQLSYGDDYLKYLSDSIALQGYSNSSFEILSHFDPAFSNSTMIKGMKLTVKQEFNRFSKVLSTKQMDEITIQVEELIKNALINITNCNFTINPKILNNNNESCKFCDFKDCCFVSFKDYVYLHEEKQGDK